ncbi:protein HAPLESS 2-B-like isoform X2 [Phragmites australis]|uniref:protein HAPLESS 2-B-like isoform X2 n=1 Tax=Phragmites australis TaxID=29695 RepID=UPI002D775740|nr:protein HAPLESS 2-B-like isoform X2 [Phragmites australis]
MFPPRPPLVAVIPVLLALLAAGGGVEILSKSRLERCVRDSGAGGRLSCDRKIVLNMAVPSGSSGGEASLVAQVTEVEENNTQAMQTIRDPPVITINKTATYALYALTYIRDVAYKPEEQFVKTRKCEPDAGAEIVKSCERLWDANGHIMEHTEPVCCPCGPQHRVPSSCGNFFDKMVKGKANTAHCLRFPGDWFHVFGIGARSLGFSIRVQVKKGSSVSEVVVGPENRTVVSGDNFLRVNLVGDFVGYTSIPSFEDFYLVTPRKGAGSGQPQILGDEYSKWMLLERVRFTLEGLECNKIGVGYEAYQNQPNFCSSPFWSCLYNQLWNFWEADKNRINRNQQPQYVVEGRFQRINQHPSAGVHTFSVGVTEVLNTNLLIELSADDIEYVYQRSPGKIISINIPTFEALSQVGTAKVTTKNIGKLEASYSLTFDCLSGISYVEEQFFIMKPDEVIIRSFYLRPSTNQAEKYRCAAILKASDFNEVDRAECQFSTTATVLDNGTQIGSSNDHKKGGIRGFFEAIKAFWCTLWDYVIDFFTGRSCRYFNSFQDQMFELFRLQLPYSVHMYRLDRNVWPATCHSTRSCSAPVASASERLIRSAVRLVGGPVGARVARPRAPEAQERPLQSLPPPRRPPPQAPRAPEAQERARPPPPPPPPRPAQARRAAARPGGGGRPPAQARRGARRSAQGSGAQAPAQQGGGRGAALGRAKLGARDGGRRARGVQGPGAPREARRARAARPRAPPLLGGVRISL